MTQYQYWRGNIFLGEDNSIEYVELNDPTECPYCHTQTNVIYNRVLEVWETDKLGRPLYYTDEGGYFHRCKHIETNPIGCPECIEEYERDTHGWGYAYGLDYEPEYDEEDEP